MLVPHVAQRSQFIKQRKCEKCFEAFLKFLDFPLLLECSTKYTVELEKVELFFGSEGHGDCNQFCRFACTSTGYKFFHAVCFY